MERPDAPADDDETPEADAEGDDEQALDAEDPDVQEAIKIVREIGQATVSLLQRRMSIGYAKASRIMDRLETLGIVGLYNGSQPREVLPYEQPEGPDDGGDPNADEA